MTTVTSSREIDRIFREARRLTQPHLSVLVAPTPESRSPGGRVAFIAGRRLGPAVTRNRSKRVLRETVRRCGGPWPGWDVVVIAREGSSAARHSVLDRELARALRSAGVVE